MSTLITQAHFSINAQRPAQPYAAGDAFYELLLAAHDGLSDEQSRALNARLVLLLSNHVGDLAVLRQALAAARAAMPHPEEKS